jgi:hypothetical protein
MPALVAGIHVFLCSQESKTWMPGTSPAMTVDIEKLRGSESYFGTFTVTSIAAK